jgi:2-hydroxychromene-2-carboxylate isomerase
LRTWRLAFAWNTFIRQRTIGIGRPAATPCFDNEPEIKERLRAATAAAERVGIFGAPTFATQAGELFWGDDRLDAALAPAAR